MAAMYSMRLPKLTAIWGLLLKNNEEVSIERQEFSPKKQPERSRSMARFGIGVKKRREK